MAIEIISLPGHLRVLFDKIYEGEVEAGTGWVVWQRVLQARPQDAPFFKRLSMVQLACRTLRQEVDGLTMGTGSITPRMKTSWLQAIDQLTSLTVPTDFHQAAAQWRQKARQSDITLLDTIHVYYNLLNMAVDFDTDQAAGMAAELNALNEELKTVELDGRVKNAVVRLSEAAKFALENMMVFGFDNAWSEGANLVGGVLRFRIELAAAAELQQKLAATAWRTMQFLAVMADRTDGVSLDTAARALLPGTPAA